MHVPAVSKYESILNLLDIADLMNAGMPVHPAAAIAMDLIYSLCAGEYRKTLRENSQLALATAA